MDRKVLSRINALIVDIDRNGNEGIGKPEPLRHAYRGYWSRRITDEHRLVYRVVEDEIRIAAAGTTTVADPDSRRSLRELA